MRLKLSLNYHLLQLNLTEGIAISFKIPRKITVLTLMRILFLCSEYRNERSWYSNSKASACYIRNFLAMILLFRLLLRPCWIITARVRTLRLVLVITHIQRFMLSLHVNTWITSRIHPCYYCVPWQIESWVHTLDYPFHFGSNKC